MEKPEPVALQYASPPPSRPRRPMVLVGTAMIAILAGAIVGAGTNAVNGVASPIYFMNIMGWQYSEVWQMSIYQGVVEGSAVGLFFSAVLTTTIAIVTRATCTWSRALRWLGGIVVAICATWTLGGIAGVCWAAIDPALFAGTFIVAPSNRGDMLRFAWVGGSIWGAEFGGFAAIIAGLIWFRIRWRLRN